MNSTAPAISVVIPTYDRKDYLLEALESVLAQHVPPDEILVVDDGSTDGTREALAPYERRIRYIRQDNQGKSAARNTGILAARGDYVAFLDSDDVWEPERIAVTRSALGAAPPDVVLAFSNFSERQLDGIPTPGTLEEKSLFPVMKRYDFSIEDVAPQTLEIGIDGNRLPCRVGALQAHLFLGNFILTSTVTARRQALIDSGLFNIAYPFSEDWDLFLRLAGRGRFLYIDRSIVQYRNHPKQAIRTLSSLDYKRLIVETLENHPSAQRAALSAFGRLAAHRLAYAYRGMALAQVRAGDARPARRYIERACRMEPWRTSNWLLRAVVSLPAPLLRSTLNLGRRTKRLLRPSR